MPRVINGHDVIADDPTPAPLHTRDGTPVYWQQTRTLHLSNGDTLYGCQHCDYTSTNWRSIRPHLAAHKDLDGTGRSNGNGHSDVDNLLAQLQQVEQTRKDCDHYKHDRDRWKRHAQQIVQERDSWKDHAQRLECEIRQALHHATGEA